MNIGAIQVPLFLKILKDKKLIKQTPLSFFDSNQGLKKLWTVIKSNPNIWENISAEQLFLLIQKSGEEIPKEVLENILNSKQDESISHEWLDEQYDKLLLLTLEQEKLKDSITRMKLLSDEASLYDIKKAVEKNRDQFSIVFNTDGEKWTNLMGDIAPDDSIPLSTGYKRFDDWNIIRKKRTTCFIGKTGGLKTKSLVNIAVRLVKNGYKVAYISFEVEQREIQIQMLCQLLKKKRTEVESMTPEERGKAWDEEYKNCIPPEIFYDSYQSYKAKDLMELIRQKEMEKPFDAIIIDYLSIIESDEEDMYSKGKKISQAFANYSKSYNWAIVTAAQTNRTGLQKVVNEMDDIAESAGALHTFDFIVSIIHYKKLIKTKECAWHLIKARYVTNGHGVGTKDTFSINWDIEGTFNETFDMRNKEILKIIKKDESKMVKDVDDEEVLESTTDNKITGTTINQPELF